MKSNTDNPFDFEVWFDEEVDQLQNDPEYIAYGLMTKLAAEVARKLEKEDLKQKDLAERLDKSPGWISRFMNDPTNFSIKKLVEIAVALDMELEVRFKESGNAGEINYDSGSSSAIALSKTAEKETK